MPSTTQLDTPAQLAPWRLVLAALLLALLSVAVFLPGFGSLPVTDRDEARFVQASRQMVESGDPVEIRLGDDARLKKPVGIYWLQSAAALASGQGAGAPLWVYRLPSLAGAVAALWLTVLIGTSLFGWRKALWGAALLAVTLIAGAEARIAKTDAMLLATVLGAQAVLVRLHMRDGAPFRGAAWGFWLALGAAVLIKGPIGPGVIATTVGTLSLVRRDLRWLAPLGAPVPILATIALVMPWFAAITWRLGPAFWTGSVGADLLPKMVAGQEGKGAPPGSYLLALWLTFWPASAALVLALPGLWRARRSRPVQFLAAWVLPWWLVLEMVPTKLLHYPLPLYPALALAAAGFAPEALRVAGRGLRLGAVVALLPGLVAAGGFFVVAARNDAGAATLAPLAAGGLLALGLAVLAGRAIRARQADRLLPLLVGAGLALWLGLFSALPGMALLWPGHRAVAEAGRLAAARGCAAPSLVGWGYSEPSLLWLGGRDTRFVPARVDLPADLAGRRCVFVVRAAEMTAPVPAACLPRGRFSGFALGAGKSVSLDLLECGARP